MRRHSWRSRQSPTSARRVRCLPNPCWSSSVGSGGSAAHPKSLDLLIEVDYELWHVHVGTDLTGPCHSVEEALTPTPALRRVDGTDTTVHWPDANRVHAADSPEATSDSTMVMINGEWWHGEQAGSEVVLVPSLPGDDEEYVTHLTWSDDTEGRAQAEWWRTDTAAVLGAIGDRCWVHYTNGHEWFLGVFEHRHDALVAFAHDTGRDPEELAVDEEDQA
jgi:hypothetical protein